MKEDLLHLSRPVSRQPLPEGAQNMFTGEIFSVHQWQQNLYDGTTKTFEKLSRSDSVGILAITPDQKIIVTKQEQPSMEPFYSLLGGVIDPGEIPFQTAQRELHEEAGGSSNEWQLWFSAQPITKIDWAIYMFIARNVELSDEQHLDGGEKIELLLLDFEEFLEIIEKEEFRDFEVSLRLYRFLRQHSEEALRKLLFEGEL